MNELRKILKRAYELFASGKTCALATVVSVQGSAYRRPGARMLFSSSGREAGFVSAACLEADLFEKVKEVIAGKSPALFSYDTTAPEDAIFGIGQGCAGFLEILIEPLSGEHSAPTLRILTMAKDQRELCVLATVFKSNGNQSEILGGRLLLTSDGTIHSSLVHELLSEMIVQDCNQALHSGQSTTNQYVYGENTADVFIEVLHQPLPLLIFGATPDVQPLVRFAAALGWNVTVVDHRSAYAEQKDFPDADAVLRFSPEEYSQRLHLTPDTYAVVMIHQFAAEANALRFLLSSDIRYVGLLGPKSKRDLLLQHLAAEGFTPRADQISTLHSPVGLDIGAETAEEIAVSIIAEITALTNNRTGGFLKDRSGSIH